MKDRVMAWVSLNAPTLSIVALIVAAVFLLTGCNTIAGMGSDITKGANWTAEKMSGSKTDQQKKAN